MAKRRQDEDRDFGSDSFLDIVANIVGILIILVMVTGVRVKHFTVDPEDNGQPLPDIQAAQSQVAELIANEAHLAQVAAQLDDQHRQQLDRLSQTQQRVAALRSSLHDRDLAKQHQQTVARQAELKPEQELKNYQDRLQSLLGDLDSAANQPRERVEVETYPTPISKSVSGPEAHFQLLGGRIAYVPLEELADVVKREIRGKVDQLRSSPELTGVVGPAHGFKLRYVLERVHVPSDPAYAGMTGGVAQVTRVTFIPESNPLGETIQQAMDRTSQMRRMLMQYDPTNTTVTLWTYPDSFAEYRQLKKELYMLGFSVAGRPLPFGKLIEGSPNGSRSAAQ